MIRAYLSGIGAAMVAICAALIYAKGRKDADNANELDDHNEYIATRKRMDAIGHVDNPAEWLRERASRDSNL